MRYRLVGGPFTGQTGEYVGGDSFRVPYSEAFPHVLHAIYKLDRARGQYITFRYEKSVYSHNQQEVQDEFLRDLIKELWAEK